MILLEEKDWGCVYYCNLSCFDTFRGFCFLLCFEQVVLEVSIRGALEMVHWLL